MGEGQNCGMDTAVAQGQPVPHGRERAPFHQHQQRQHPQPPTTGEARAAQDRQHQRGALGEAPHEGQAGEAGQALDQEVGQRQGAVVCEHDGSAILDPDRPQCEQSEREGTRPQRPAARPAHQREESDTEHDIAKVGRVDEGLAIPADLGEVRGAEVTSDEHRPGVCSARRATDHGQLSRRLDAHQVAGASREAVLQKRHRDRQDESEAQRSEAAGSVRPAGA